MDASWLTLALAATAAAGLFVDAWLARLPGAPDGLSIEADRTPAPDAPAAVAAGQTPLAWRTRLSVAAVSTFVRRHFHDLAVAAAVAAAGLYTWVFFPRPGPDIRPGQIGSLFNGLRFIFELAGRHADAWAGLVGGAALGAALGLVIMAAAAQRAGRPAAARRRGAAAAVVGALGLIGLGQLGLFGLYAGPTVPFAAGIALAAAWAWRYRARLETDVLDGAWPRAIEWIAVGAVLGATAFLRLYGLHVIPYGIEGDESKWVVEVMASMRFGQYPEGADFHLYAVPGSFFMQAPFHAWLGPGLYAARVTVALYSVAGSAVFYGLTRRLLNAPVAWLATFLLAISPFDVSASRLANVESHVKLMPLVALACLEWATRTGRTRGYALAGIATALGLLTYDTVLPLLGVALVIIGATFVAERRPAAARARRLAAFAMPIMVATPILVGYFAGRFGYYGVERPGAPEPWLARLGANAAELAHGIFVATPGDMLFNRFGPMFNAALLPWLVLGLVLAVVGWRTHRLGWWVIFAGLFFVPVPILTGVTGARVVYPGLPAAYALIALAMYAAGREVARACGPVLRPALAALAVLGLAVVAYSNLYITFNQVFDPDDRQLRRELMDTARAASGADALALFPFQPGSGDPIEAERHFAVWMGVVDPDDPSGATHPHAAVPLDDLLPALGDALGRHARIEVVWDIRGQGAASPKAAALAAFLRCYPMAVPRPRGRFYQRYSLAGDAVPAAGCPGSAGLAPLSTPGATLPSGPG